MTVASNSTVLSSTFIICGESTAKARLRASFFRVRIAGEEALGEADDLDAVLGGAFEIGEDFGEVGFEVEFDFDLAVADAQIVDLRF